MRNRLLILAGLCLALAGCRKQEEAPRRVEMEILAAQAGEKSQLSGTDVLWVSGDALSVYDGTSNNRFICEAGGKSAKFKGAAAVRSSYYVLYPYSGAAVFEGSVIHTSIPTSQLATAGGFAADANVSAGRSEANAVAMKNAGCYLKFTVGGTSPAISSVSVNAPGGEGLSGNICVDLTDGFVVESETGSQPSAVIAPASGTFEAGIYYMVLVPSKPSQGIEIKLTLSTGKVCTYSFSTLKTLDRNKVYTVTGNIEKGILTITNESFGGEVYSCDAPNEEYALERTPWNDWNNAADVMANLRKAQSQKKSYFSNYKYYPWASEDGLNTAKVARYGRPMIYSVDFYQATGDYGAFSDSERARNRRNILKIVKGAWKRDRAVLSVSWHLESPYAVYGVNTDEGMGCRFLYGSAFPRFPGIEYRSQIRDILNNREVPQVGRLGDWFDAHCREVAEYINEMVDDDGKPIPIIFRLWHEFEDHWAWWQNDYWKYPDNTKEEYIAFFRLTVDKFRTYCPKAELLFGYGSDRQFTSKEQFLENYPGDDYVDVIGYDDYYIGQPNKFTSTAEMKAAAIGKARIVTAAAAERGKVAALFESNNGYENPENPTDEANVQKKYFEYVQDMLSDSEVNIPLIQFWSNIENNDSKKEALASFLKQDNIIFIPAE